MFLLMHVGEILLEIKQWLGNYITQLVTLYESLRVSKSSSLGTVLRFKVAASG